mmetsp:Transcript_1949/g.4081  ORF Transcript_1949/g.4081 Transcript_1949/m.4081 type:complete len:82 (-) Transcript_1949:25-270(-)
MKRMSIPMFQKIPSQTSTLHGYSMRGGEGEAAGYQEVWEVEFSRFQYFRRRALVRNGEVRARAKGGDDAEDDEFLVGSSKN